MQRWGEWFMVAAVLVLGVLAPLGLLTLAAVRP